MRLFLLHVQVKAYNLINRPDGNKKRGMVLKRNVAYFGLNLLGIVACIYSLHVEISKANDKGYVAMCDLSYRASCSKVVTSEYVRPGNLFFLHEVRILNPEGRSAHFKHRGLHVDVCER